MGSCATCVNPERSILKYRVSRLDQKSNVKEKLSESAVVQRDKHVYGNMSPQSRIISNTLLPNLIKSASRQSYQSPLPHKNSTSDFFNEQSSIEPALQTIINSVIRLREQPPQPQSQRSQISNIGLKRTFSFQTNEIENTMNKSQFRPAASRYQPVQTIPQVNSIDQIAMTDIEDEQKDSKLSSRINQSKNDSRRYQSQLLQSAQTLLQNRNTLRQSAIQNMRLELQEPVRTPPYVNQLKKEYGQDIPQIDYSFFPILIEEVSPLNLHIYLRDLQLVDNPSG